jgi:hypothetical protein
MISNYINIKLFIVSLALGLFCVYITGADIKIIHIYPTPENSNNMQYKDKSDQCFEVKANEVSCPSMPFMTNTIPIQE